MTKPNELPWDIMHAGELNPFAGETCAIRYEQARALWEGANIIVKYQHQILNEDAEDFMRAVALLKKGIGE